jgi:outer membrane murein-binding lipoprotein Lpp
MSLPDWTWKIFTVVLGVLIMPLAGWVWSVNVEVAQLRNDVGDLEAEVSRLESKVEEQEKNSRSLIGVERDIEHIRDILDRIEDLVAG